MSLPSAAKSTLQKNRHPRGRMTARQKGENGRAHIEKDLRVSVQNLAQTLGPDLIPNKSIELRSHSLPPGQTWVEYLASDQTPCYLQLESEDHREAITVTDTAYWTTSECSGGCPLYYYARNKPI